MAFVRDSPGRPVPEETLTHSHPTWSSDILYHLPPFTTIHGILFVHFTCLFCCITNAMSSIPSLSLNSLLGSLSFSLMPHMTWPFSSLLAEVPPRFLSLQARSHFHATCCFAHNTRHLYIYGIITYFHFGRIFILINTQLVILFWVIEFHVFH